MEIYAEEGCRRLAKLLVVMDLNFRVKIRNCREVVEALRNGTSKSVNATLRKSGEELLGLIKEIKKESL